MENAQSTSSAESKKKSSESFNPSVLIWVIAGILVLVAGWFGIRALFAPFSVYRVTLIDAPKEVPVGTIATFTWRVDGASTTISSTAVQLGLTSVPGDLTKETKPGDTAYTEMVQDFANGQFNIPLQFVGNIRLPKVGKYYFRVHALVNDKHYWSPEYSLDVVPADYKVSLVDAPKEIAAGKVGTFTWRVDGPATVIKETAVFFGTLSTPGKLGKEVKPVDTEYRDMVHDFENGSYDVPIQFVGNAKVATPGAYFFRVHALVNGENYWTDEFTFDSKVVQEPTSATSSGSR